MKFVKNQPTKKYKYNENFSLSFRWRSIKKHHVYTHVWREKFWRKLVQALGIKRREKKKERERDIYDDTFHSSFIRPFYFAHPTHIIHTTLLQPCVPLASSSLSLFILFLIHISVLQALFAIYYTYTASTELHSHVSFPLLLFSPKFSVVFAL